MSKAKFSPNPCGCSSTNIEVAQKAHPRVWYAKCRKCGAEEVTDSPRKIDAVRAWNSKHTPA